MTVVKTLNFCNEKVNFNISALVGLKYRAEFGKNLFSFFEELKKLAPKFKEMSNMTEDDVMEALDMKFLEDSVEVVYIMYKYGGNNFKGSIEDFYGRYSYMDLITNSLEIVVELFSTTMKTTNPNVGFKNKNKKKKKGK